MIFIFLAALLWGITNPLLKKYSAGFAKSNGVISDLRFLFSRPKYLITQLLNLSGSVAFFAGLREVDVSVGSVVANTSAFLITTMVSVIVLREGALSGRAWLGIMLVVVGVTLCTMSK